MTTKIICCALCDCDGEPDYLSKYVTAIPKSSTLIELSKKVVKKMLSISRQNIELISSYWYRTLMNDKHKTISITEIIRITIMYHNASILPQTEDDINNGTVRIWRKKTA